MEIEKCEKSYQQSVILIYTYIMDVKFLFKRQQRMEIHQQCHIIERDTDHKIHSKNSSHWKKITELENAHLTLLT